MKAFLMVAILTVAAAGAAEARSPFEMSAKPTAQRLFTLGVISSKPLPPAKVLRSWVLHNPYKPQAVKLAFVD